MIGRQDFFDDTGGLDRWAKAEEVSTTGVGVVADKVEIATKLILAAAAGSVVVAITAAAGNVAMVAIAAAA